MSALVDRFGAGPLSTLFKQSNEDTFLTRIHIIGRKNHGKTTLVVELVRRLTEVGMSVGTIKHTHHAHELDTPGKDSFLHRQAGADAVGIVAQNLSAVFWPTPGRNPQAGDKYQQFESLMSACDIVLVEGDQNADATKIEVWRAEIGSSPLALEDDSILAVVSDDHVSVSCSVYPRHGLSSLVNVIVKLRSSKQQ